MAIHFSSLRPAVVKPLMNVRAPAVTARTTRAATVAARTATDAAPAAASSGSDPAADFRALFGGAAASAAAPATTTAPASSAPNKNAVPTVDSVFGPSPWLANPTGTCPNGEVFGYNPIYFATPATAQKVAQMVGGSVVQDFEFTKNTPGNPFSQQQPNQMVQLANGALINPGLVASFYTHGYPRWMVDQMVANEVAGATRIDT
jgi:hypothetical protein